MLKKFYIEKMLLNRGLVFEVANGDISDIMSYIANNMDVSSKNIKVWKNKKVFVLR